jgi:hypothetical protein
LISWLHELPVVVGAALIILFFLVPTIIGVSLLQPIIVRLLRREKDPSLPVGYLLNAFTLYYAVLLALLSVAVFENYNKANDAVGREATAIVAFYRDLRGYPEPARSELIGLLQRYLDEEIGLGWRSQRTGETAAATTALVNKIDLRITSIRPEGDTADEALHFNTLERFDDWVERRRARIQAGRTHIPLILWYVVLVGAALNVIVIWLVDLSRSTHLIVSGVLISFIGLVIYMVAILDRPFLGPAGIGPDYLVQASQQIRRP